MFKVISYVIFYFSNNVIGMRSNNLFVIRNII